MGLPVVASEPPVMRMSTQNEIFDGKWMCLMRVLDYSIKSWITR